MVDIYSPAKAIVFRILQRKRNRAAVRNRQKSDSGHSFFRAEAALRQHPRRRGVLNTEATAMYQVRKDVLRIRRVTAAAVLLGSFAWLGLMIGAETAQSPSARHLAGQSSAARQLLQGQLDKYDGK